jgi:hypothetical protein
MTEWITSHSRLLEIVAGFGFGILFAVKGITTLI